VACPIPAPELPDDRRAKMLGRKIRAARSEIAAAEKALAGVVAYWRGQIAGWQALCPHPRPEELPPAAWDRLTECPWCGSKR
jgi:hypothetical protein